MQFEILVSLKKEVLNPEARAIQETLGRLGFQAVQSVKVAKRYVIEINEESVAASKLAEQIAREYLANPVAETFEIRPIS